MVEGCQPGIKFDYRNLKFTDYWHQLADSGNSDALAIAISNIILLDQIFVVSCSNNEDIIEELENSNRDKRFQWITCD